jgi:taurine dioxygenase
MWIAPLPQGFGAEVSDFDVQIGREPEDIAQLQQAFGDHHLLIFRAEGQITPERQVEITGWFGPVIAEGTAWTVLDNVEPAGSKELPFHSDITFLEFPLAGISLYPQELPANNTSTTYVSNAVAWRQLPEPLQKELRCLKARHYFDASHEVGFDWPVLEYWHPVCLLHPTTGQPLLFVTEHHVDRIEHMTEVRSAELLKELFATLYAAERRYEHVWRRGELVIWDNLAIQHARTRAAELSQGKRVMRRVQLGKIGFMEQLKRVRLRRAESAN